MIRSVFKKTLSEPSLLSALHKCSLIVFMSLSVFIYTAIYTHVPISLQLYQTYDDALFIRLGESLASGHWLGHFNQLTLAKGAGYPIFLALSSWMGAPVTFTQAAFYVAAAFLLWLVAYEITCSRLFSTLVFLLVLFNPNVFQERILRESIYTSQTVTLLCITWLAFFKDGKRGKFFIPVVAGFMLGWFWITREEGIWILPGIVVLFFTKFIRNKFMRNEFSELRKVEIFRQLGLYFSAFLFVLCVVSLINFRHYGAFVGVDIKDPSFTAAMQQLQRVHVGKEIPYVPLSKESRERLYELSPDFALLKPTLDPPVGSNPSIGSECWIWPSACHDFSAGQLLWQIRNAAAATGKYSSERGARRYFRQLAHQVSQICERKEVPCYGASPIAIMPHLHEAQLKSVWPSIMSVWNLLLQKNPQGWIDAPPSNGSQSELDNVRRFLNYPLSTDVVSSHATVSRVVAMSGWFLSGTNGWFTLDTPLGAEASVTRLASPDIAKAFPKAVRQRFQIILGCGAACEIKFVSQSGDVFDFNPDSVPELHNDIHYGHSVIAFDGVTIQGEKTARTSAIESLSRKSRLDLYRLYSIVITPLFYIGLLCFIATIVFFPKQFFSSEASIFAAAVAVVILSRSTILLLINISSFPSLTPSYFSPVLCLLPVYSMFAIWSLINAVISSPLSWRWARW